MCLLSLNLNFWSIFDPIPLIFSGHLFKKTNKPTNTTENDSHLDTPSLCRVRLGLLTVGFSRFFSFLFFSFLFFLCLSLAVTFTIGSPRRGHRSGGPTRRQLFSMPRSLPETFFCFLFFFCFFTLFFLFRSSAFLATRTFSSFRADYFCLFMEFLFFSHLKHCFFFFFFRERERERDRNIVSLASGERHSADYFQFQLSNGAVLLVRTEFFFFFYFFFGTKSPPLREERVAQNGELNLKQKSLDFFCSFGFFFGAAILQVQGHQPKTNKNITKQWNPVKTR